MTFQFETRFVDGLTLAFNADAFGKIAVKGPFTASNGITIVFPEFLDCYWQSPYKTSHFIDNHLMLTGGVMGGSMFIEVEDHFESVRTALMELDNRFSDVQPYGKGKYARTRMVLKQKRRKEVILITAPELLQREKGTYFRAMTGYCLHFYDDKKLWVTVDSRDIPDKTIQPYGWPLPERAILNNYFAPNDLKRFIAAIVNFNELH